VNIEHEAELAAAGRNKHWYAISKGTDGRRTTTELWTLMTQQSIGLTLFSTLGSYFFQQAGVKDPSSRPCFKMLLASAPVSSSLHSRIRSIDV
jgi:hypothetical protein